MVLRLWSTELLANDLKEIKLLCFVKPGGLVQCKYQTIRSYQAYELLTSEELEEIDELE